MTRVVVTGGSGKLGRAVVEELAADGFDVVVLDRVPPRDPWPHVRVDLTDYGQTVEALTSIDDRYGSVDAVVHLAAIPAPGLIPNAATFMHNVGATYHIFAAARLAKIKRVVWASSETLLGLALSPENPPPYIPVDEEYPARPESSYSLSKHVEETIAAQFCRWDPELTMVGLRFSNVMEPGDYARFPSWQDDPSRRIWNVWGYIDARDGAQAVRLALDYPRKGLDIFVIANADTVMERTSAELAAESFPDVPVTRSLAGNETLLSIEKARRLLGYEPRYTWRDHVES